jgi:hypothetical protein
MAPEDQASPSSRQHLLKWALILGIIVIAAWLIAYALGIEIYDALLGVTR